MLPIAERGFVGTGLKAWNPDLRQLKIAVPLGGANMKKTLVVAAVVGLALLGTAAEAPLPQVDPATVPSGGTAGAPHRGPG